MKKVLLIICLVAATTANLALAQNYVTLDLKNTNFQFNEEGAWNQTYQTDTALVIKHATFYHGAGTGFWEGFTLANNNDSTWHEPNQWLNYQWGIMTGGGVLFAQNETPPADPLVPYIVATQPFYGEWTVTLDKQYKPIAIYIANHPYPYYVNIDGNNFARKLDQKGDSLTLSIHGLIQGEEHLFRDIPTVQHLLAFVDETGILQQSKNWQYLDLTPLTTFGNIDKLTFSLRSTDNSEWGMNTPAYFCIGELILLDSQENIQHIDNHSHAFPNPAYHTLNVTGIGIHYVNVFTTNGTLVKQVTGNNANTLQLNTSNWQQGNYIIQVNDDNGAHVHKVVKK